MILLYKDCRDFLINLVYVQCLETTSQRVDNLVTGNREYESVLDITMRTGAQFRVYEYEASAELINFRDGIVEKEEA